MIECSHLLYKLKDKITVVIPSYNSSEHIGGLLDAISNQYYSAGMSIIVADLGSEDNTIEIIEEKQKELKNLNIQLLENKSLYQLRKIALERCETPYILFVDADTKLFSEWTFVNSAIWLHKKNTEVATVNLRSYNATKSYIYKALIVLNKWMRKIVQKLDGSAENSYFCVSYDDFLHFGRFNGNDLFEFSKKFPPTDFKITSNKKADLSKERNYSSHWRESIMEFTNVKKGSKVNEESE